MTIGKKDTNAGLDEVDIVQSDVYYAQLLKSFKDDDDRLTARTEQDQYRFLSLLAADKTQDEADPTSPFSFMKSMKFQLWGRSLSSRTQSLTPNDSEFTESLKATRDKNRLVFMCQREVENSGPSHSGQMHSALKELKRSERNLTAGYVYCCA
jgi:hypothetical protein